MILFLTSGKGMSESMHTQAQSAYSVVTNVLGDTLVVHGMKGMPAGIQQSPDIRMIVQNLDL